MKKRKLRLLKIHWKENTWMFVCQCGFFPFLFERNSFKPKGRDN